MLFQCVWLFAFAKSVYFSVNGIRWGDEVGTTCLLILCTIDASIKLVPIEFRPFEGECTPPHKTCWGNGSECQRGYDKLRFEIYTHLQCFILHLPFFHCGGNAGQSEPRIGSWNWCCIPCSAGRIHLSLEDALRRSRWTYSCLGRFGTDLLGSHQVPAWNKSAAWPSQLETAGNKFDQGDW